MTKSQKGGRHRLNKELRDLKKKGGAGYYRKSNSLLSTNRPVCLLLIRKCYCPICEALVSLKTCVVTHALICVFKYLRGGGDILNTII